MITQTEQSTQEIANRLVQLCRKGQVREAGEELYAQDIVSVEPPHSPLKSAMGKKAVGEKGAQFAASIEQRHSGSFSDPVVAGRFFCINMLLDATFIGKGRMTLEELCLYEVKDGKIVKEQFFF